ncbi:MAG: ABC transporter permease [Dehalococcoidales bacterium]|nr:ABC transporter permease [Dehalococcoidales bacterium]
MKLKRIRTLIKNEVFHGPKDMVLVMSVAMPVLLALFFNLAFGNIFSDRAALGLLDKGDSEMATLLQSSSSINLKIYNNEDDLKAAAANGSIDMGIILPAGFDNMIQTGSADIQAYTWGESMLKHRVIIGTILNDAIHDISGSTLPVNIETIALGDVSSVPWNDRLLPMIILTAIFFGGMMLPAASLINEKNKHTLEALSVSPATIGEIFTAKGTIGAMLALVMGVLTLAISGQFHSSFLSLILVMGLGAVMAAQLGLIAGAYIRDMNTLFALWKFGGLLLFGPAVVYMFPQIPQWIGYIFPTFYVIKPVVDLTINGLGFDSIIFELVILIAIVAAIMIIINRIVVKLSSQALRLN